LSLGLFAVVALLAVAAGAIFWPLRTARRPGAPEEEGPALEIARDAKLAELNDLELDFRLGKLSTEDYRAVNAALRAEAVEIILLLDASAGNGSRKQPRSNGR
jgi:hypothetical protein